MTTFNTRVLWRGVGSASFATGKVRRVATGGGAGWQIERLHADGRLYWWTVNAILAGDTLDVRDLRYVVGPSDKR